MNWYKKARYGGSDQERSIWYHGTRGKNLQKILSEGLVAYPKQRAWKEDPHSNFNSPSRASLGGVYLTQNLMTARSSALKDKDENENMIIVVVEAQPRTFLMDEDDITHIISPAIKSDKFIPNEYLVAELYMAKKMNSNNEYIQRTKSEYVRKCIEEILYRLTIPNDTIKNKLASLLETTWEKALDRQSAYIDDRDWKNAFYRNITPEVDANIHKVFKELRDQYGKESEIADKKYEDYVNSLVPPKPNKQSSESEFAQIINAITRLLKYYARPLYNKDKYNKIARTEEDIGFSGSNKIVCILSEDNYYNVNIVYGTMPQQLIDDWTRSVGQLQIEENENL